MTPAFSSQSDDSSFLALVLQVLGVEKPEGALPLPVDLMIDGQFPVRICQVRQRWVVCGTIATEISECEEYALLSLLERASGMWGTLEGTFCYEKKEDILVLWRDISDSKEQELESIMSRFLEELEFWRMEGAEAGCTGREVFP